MAWWRAHDEALDDPKLQRLDGDLFKTWFNLMCLANRNNGVLPSPEDIAFALRTTPEDFGPKLRALAQAGLFDRENGAWTPHNWNGRQYKSDVSTERVRRFRKRHETVSGNAPEQSRAETEQNRAEQRARPRAGKAAIPEDWKPTDDLVEYAKQQGCSDPVDTFERFRLHHAGKGTLHKDWHSAAQYWCRNEKNFRRPSGAAESDPWAGVDI